MLEFRACIRVKKIQLNLSWGRILKNIFAFPSSAWGPLITIDHMPALIFGRKSRVPIRLFDVCSDLHDYYMG